MKKICSSSVTLQHFDSAQLRVVLRANRLKEHGSIIVTLTLSSARTFEIAPPEPSLTPREMIGAPAKGI